MIEPQETKKPKEVYVPLALEKIFDTVFEDNLVTHMPIARIAYELRRSFSIRLASFFIKKEVPANVEKIEYMKQIYKNAFIQYIENNYTTTDIEKECEFIENNSVYPYESIQRDINEINKIINQFDILDSAVEMTKDYN